MTKIQFANIPNGTRVRNTETLLVYRLRERIARKLVLERITPQASAQLIEIVHSSQRNEYNIEK